MSHHIGYEIEFFKHTSADRSPVDQYLDDMPDKHRQKAMAIMARLEVEGPNLKRPHADIVRGKIRELRCGFNTFEHRFLYFFHNKTIVLTHGFLKKTRTVPIGEFAKAMRSMGEWLKQNHI